MFIYSLSIHIFEYVLPLALLALLFRSIQSHSYYGGVVNSGLKLILNSIKVGISLMHHKKSPEILLLLRFMRSTHGRQHNSLGNIPLN